MVGLQTLNLAIGVRVPASQPIPSDSLFQADFCCGKTLGCRVYRTNPDDFIIWLTLGA